MVIHISSPFSGLLETRGIWSAFDRDTSKYSKTNDKIAACDRIFGNAATIHCESKTILMKAIDYILHIIDCTLLVLFCLDGVVFRMSFS